MKTALGVSYCSILWTLTTYGDQSVVFSKGHRGMPYCGEPWYNTNHISLIDHNGVNVHDRYHISTHTSSENTVTIIWHCESAEHYFGNGTIPEDDFGCYGMPYCWTHNASMPSWGANGTQVFLGWVDQSPQFETQANGMWNHAHVAYLFWYYMCDWNKTVEGALNALCDDTM
jgi:hypothetical protein